jgi:hypothetical protein
MPAMTEFNASIRGTKSIGGRIVDTFKLIEKFNTLMTRPLKR